MDRAQISCSIADNISSELASVTSVRNYYVAELKLSAATLNSVNCAYVPQREK